MTIYLDVVLLENILMNILIIYFANYLSKQRNNMYKICISSIIGAVYYVVLLLPEREFLNFYLYKIILSMIMVLVGFNNKNIFNYISNMMFFYISSFIFGGAIYGIYQMFFNNTNFEYYPIKIALLAIGVTAVAIKNIRYYIYLNSKYSKLVFEVDIHINKKIKRINVFLDTGNSLKDPGSKKKRRSGNLDGVKEILPEKIYCIAKNELKDIGEVKDSRAHVIPYISLGNQNGLMLGYRVDKIVINTEKEEKIKLDSVILGLNTTNLNSIKDVDGLISIELLEKGGGFNEYRKNKVG